MTYQSAPRSGLDAPPLPALPLPPFRPALAKLPLLALLPLIAAALAAAPAAAQSLYGSHESLLRQNLVAQQHDYAYLRNTQEVVQAVDGGVLVPVHGNEDYQLAGGEVSFPYARQEVKTFLEQLAHAYRAACGEPLVVTSLVRPISRQPWNASPISVHPTGMAVDMRRSDRHGCRLWLESTLLALEGEGMIEATREHWPPHYHVAVFPDPLLLPGPIGDPNGVVRVAALAALHGGTMLEADAASVDVEPLGRPGRVHVGRSSRTGRLRISQTGVARHGQRPAGPAVHIALHRPSARQGQHGRSGHAASAGRHATAASRSAAATGRGVTAKRHAHSRATATATAR